MKLKCKYDPIGHDGQKVMEFTAGEVYEFSELSDGGFEVYDDNGRRELFFNPYILFQAV